MWDEDYVHLRPLGCYCYYCNPQGIAPILPLFRESILNGLPEDKENAALMLGEVIKLTSAAALQPSVVHVTGPLIRILGDRFNASVKAAVLDTLASLLAKVFNAYITAKLIFQTCTLHDLKSCVQHLYVN